MTLMERARLCSERIAEYTQLNQALNQDKDLQERQGQFSTARKQLEPETRRLETLRSRGTLALQTGRVPAVEAQLQELVKRIPQDPTYVIQEFKGTKTTQFFEGIATLAGEIRTAVSDHWRHYREGKIPALNTELLDALAGVPAFEGTVRQLTTEWQKLRDLGDRIPNSAQDLDSFDRQTAKVQDLWRNLEESNVPPDVIAFLKAAATQGASLDLLTDEVHEWLRRHRMNGQFSVRTKQVRR